MRFICEGTACLVQSGSFEVLFENVSNQNAYLQFTCTLSGGRLDCSVILLFGLHLGQKKTFLGFPNLVKIKLCE